MKVTWTQEGGAELSCRTALAIGSRPRGVCGVCGAQGMEWSNALRSEAVVVSCEAVELWSAAGSWAELCLSASSDSAELLTPAVGMRYTELPRRPNPAVTVSAANTRGCVACRPVPAAVLLLCIYHSAHSSRARPCFDSRLPLRCCCAAACGVRGCGTGRWAGPPRRLSPRYTTAGTPPAGAAHRQPDTQPAAHTTRGGLSVKRRPGGADDESGVASTDPLAGLLRVGERVVQQLTGRTTPEQ